MPVDDLPRPGLPPSGEADDRSHPAESGGFENAAGDDDHTPGTTPVVTPTTPGAERSAGGRFAPGNRQLSTAGGVGKRQRVALAAGLGLKDLDTWPGWEPYKRSCRAYRQAQCHRIARLFGAGELGPGPSSIVASATLALAASRYLYDHADGDPKRLDAATRQGEASARLLQQAEAMARREAEAAAAARRANPHWSLATALAGQDSCGSDDPGDSDDE
jgi:hypothetical protein